MLLIISVLIICLVEAGTKGWWTLILLPASIVILPVVFFIQVWARRVALREPTRRDLTPLRIAQLMAVLMLYVTAVGFGDTKDDLLFGFVRSNIDSTMTQISSNLNNLSLFLLPIMTLWLVIRLIFIRLAKPKLI